MITSKNNSETDNWFVYIIVASDKRLYTGITNNMEKRWGDHCKKRGARFFYGRNPVALVFLEGEHTRSSASKREYRIKQLCREQKWQFVINQYRLAVGGF